MLIGGLTGARLIASKLDEGQRSRFWNIIFMQVCCLPNFYCKQCTKYTISARSWWLAWLLLSVLSQASRRNAAYLFSIK